MVVVVEEVTVVVRLGSEVNPGVGGEAEVDSGGGGEAEQAVGEIIIPPQAKSSDAALPLAALVLQHIHLPPPLPPLHNQS